MALMRTAWVSAMVAVIVLALLPVEHLQLPVFDGWDKAQHALAFWVLTGWALLLWPLAMLRVVFITHKPTFVLAFMRFELNKVA
jgi:hypothetical protein